MKRFCFAQVVIMVMVLFLTSIVSTSVFAEETTGEMGVAYRGHVQNKGNVPQLENSYIDGPTELGTRGAGLRIEGFQFKLTGTVPEGMQIRYNVHVQNKGWLYNVDDPTKWAENSEFAGTKGESLRIEAIKIILLDANGDDSNGYSVLYRGHAQNVGNLPAADDAWLQDGAQLGTTGSGLRLEAIQVKIVKTDSSPELEAYKALITTINSLTEKDYTPNTWAELQTTITNNTVTFEGNTVKEIKAATAAIQSAYDKLVKKESAVVYDTFGTYGPTSGTQVINGDVIVNGTGITLQNLQINGDLIINGEPAAEKTEEIAATALDDGQITTKPVINTGSAAVIDTFVYGNVTMGNATSMVVTGSQPRSYQILNRLLNIQAQMTTTGSSTGGASAVVLVGSDSTLTFGGIIGGLTLGTAGSQATLSPGCIVQQMTIQPGAPNCLVTTVPSSQIYNLTIEGSGAGILGLGQIDNAQILANGASFGNRPFNYTVGSDVTVFPSMPSPPAPSNPDPPVEEPPIDSSPTPS